jgi:hypothetical protein
LGTVVLRRKAGHQGSRNASQLDIPPCRQRDVHNISDDMHRFHLQH